MNKIAGHAGHNLVGHRETGLRIWGYWLGTPARLSIFGLDAAGRRRVLDSRAPSGEGKGKPRVPGLTVGEAPLWAGMEDANNPGTHAESRDRKRKFACVSHSPSACGIAPKEPIFFSAIPFFFSGGRRGRRVQGKQQLCPPCVRLDVRRLGAGAPHTGDPAGAGGSRLLRHLLSLHLSRPPSISPGFLLCTYCARAACSRHTGGAVEPPPQRLPILRS